MSVRQVSMYGVTAAIRLMPSHSSKRSTQSLGRWSPGYCAVFAASTHT